MAAKTPFILWLTGASGVGKTTTFHVLEARCAHTSWGFMHLDGIERPCTEEMAKLVGPLSAEQDCGTHWWIRKALSDYPHAEVVVVDGQCNLAFVEDACQHSGISNYAIVLLDCDWATISDRLINQRQQPHLANPRMENWTRYLRNQAVTMNALVIDTSQHTTLEVVDQILNMIEAIG